MATRRCFVCQRPTKGHPGPPGSLRKYGPTHCTNFLEHNLKLHTNPDYFRIVSETDVMTINRQTGAITVLDKVGDGPDLNTGIPIVGIVGMINLVSGLHVIFATKKDKVGTIGKMTIHRLADWTIIPLNSNEPLNRSQLETESTLTKMVLQVLGTPSLYFSHDGDITNTRQRHADNLRSPESLDKSLLERCDMRFLWNKFLLDAVRNNFVLDAVHADRKVERLCLHLVHGFAAFAEMVVPGHTLKYGVVSRRSTERPGLRLNVRGIDENGHVANFVETEQLVEVDGTVASFEQSRGSIPLLWSQIPEARRLYADPPPMLDAQDVEDHKDQFAKHFRTQVGLYEHQAILNLVRQQGAEGRLEEMLGNTEARVGNNSVSYVPLDFHRECTRMKWKQLERLVTEDQRLVQFHGQNGYFLQDTAGVILERQSGVFRTNCIDCLDRTSVVQSFLARMNLRAVLMRLRVLDVVRNEVFFEEVKDIWVENSHLLSLQHSGSGAIYTQITKTGKYDVIGQMKDWCSSIKRYYVNNFQDGYNQDAIELFLGKIRVVTGAQDTPPVGRQVERKIQMVASVVLMLAMALLFLISPEMSWYGILATIFSVLVVFGCMMAVGVLIVGRDHPRLRPQPN